jgi:RNA polymerase sigma-70 factor, ECF subfamily
MTDARSSAPAVQPSVVHGVAVCSRSSARTSEEAAPLLTEDARTWIAALRGPAGPRDQALSELHDLLLRAAHFELSRRRGQLWHLSAGDIEDLGTQAADDALMAILGKLDSFRGASRFTTWAYKFALLEAGVKARRRAWQGREIVVDEETWPEFPDTGRSAHDCLEDAELLRVLRDGIRSALTPHQREVFCALALNGIPIDVLAERLSTTRGALYKTLHDARRKLRATLAGAGYPLDDETAGRWT